MVSDAVSGALSSASSLLSSTAHYGFYVGAIGGIVAGGYYGVNSRLRMIGKDEQLFIETATELIIVNGPKVMVMPMVIKSAVKKKAVTLTNTDYCVVQNSLTGAARNEVPTKVKVRKIGSSF